MAADAVVDLDRLVLSLSDALDLVHPAAHAHQQRVAYIAVRLGRALGRSPSDQADLMYAAALHDIGVFSEAEKAEGMQFDFESRPAHIRRGTELLGALPAFRAAADLVRFHHQPWGDEAGWHAAEGPVRLPANAIHLADCVDRIFRRDSEILAQAREVCATVAGLRGSEFAPELVEAFLGLAASESFWLDYASPRICDLLPGLAEWAPTALPPGNLDEVARVFSRIVDFRSPFTAAHSVGVAVAAGELARRAGFGEGDARLMRIAGLLHDLGKVCVPSAILEKPAKLDAREFDVIRGHSYYTWRILSAAGGLGEIGRWAAYHHERLDGTGYPFRVGRDALSPGCRIMCVADVFTALTELRPYRRGTARGPTLLRLRAMVRDGALDGRVVDALDDGYGEIDAARSAAQSVHAAEYADRFARDG